MDIDSRRSAERRAGLTQAQVQGLLHYDPTTGVFTNKVNRGRAKAGERADTSGTRGYRQLVIGGVLYRASRVAWLYVTGAWPAYDVDHRNGIPSDNRFDNLRDVTAHVNQQNRQRANRQNRAGMLGVTLRRGRFQARIRIEGEIRHIGTFDNAGAAHAAYLDVKRSVHEGCLL